MNESDPPAPDTPKPATDLSGQERAPKTAAPLKAPTGTGGSLVSPPSAAVFSLSSDLSIQQLFQFFSALLLNQAEKERARVEAERDYWRSQSDYWEKEYYAADKAGALAANRSGTAAGLGRLQTAVGSAGALLMGPVLTQWIADAPVTHPSKVLGGVGILLWICAYLLGRGRPAVERKSDDLGESGRSPSGGA